MQIRRFRTATLAALLIAVCFYGARLRAQQPPAEAIETEAIAAGLDVAAALVTTKGCSTASLEYTWMLRPDGFDGRMSGAYAGDAFDVTIIGRTPLPVPAGVGPATAFERAGFDYRLSITGSMNADGDSTYDDSGEIIKGLLREVSGRWDVNRIGKFTKNLARTGLFTMGKVLLVVAVGGKPAAEFERTSKRPLTDPIAAEVLRQLQTGPAGATCTLKSKVVEEIGPVRRATFKIGSAS